jgi:uncharacterized protein involved in exopolysaccharide biosynthesis
MALVFVAIFGAVCAYTVLTEEVYQSEAKLLIRIGRESLSVDPSVSGPTLYSSRDRENEVNSELSILTSRAIAEQVVQRLGAEVFLERPDESEDVTPPVQGMETAQQDLRKIRREVRKTEEAGAGLLAALDLTTPLSPEEEAVLRVMKNTGVNVETKTDIITITYDAPSRPLARNALSTMLDAYQERHIQVHAAQASPEFFEEQTDSFRKHLEESEMALTAFRETHRITDLEHQLEVMLVQVSDLEKQVADLDSEASASKRRIETMESALNGRSETLVISQTTGRPNYAANTLKEKLLELRLQETDLAARYPATHRPLVEIREQIRQAETHLAGEVETHTEVTTGIDASYQQLQLNLEGERAQFAAFNAQRDVLATTLAGQREQMAALAGRQFELSRLEREVSLAEKDYEQYRENLQRARISNALDIGNVSNVSVVQPATYPMAPIKPRKLLNLALGIFLAFFASISFVMTLEYFDDSVSSPEQIEKWVGVPVLVTVTDKEYKACI